MKPISHYIMCTTDIFRERKNFCCTNIATSRQRCNVKTPEQHLNHVVVATHSFIGTPPHMTFLEHTISPLPKPPVIL